MEQSRQQAEYSEITLLEVGRTFWNHRWLFAVLGALCLGGALALSFLMTPVYRASTILAPAESNDSGSKLGALSSQLGGLAALAGLTASGSVGVDESIAILGSRSFTNKFISERQLLPELFAGIWDAENKTWLVDDPVDVPTLADGYALMNNSIRNIKRDMSTGLITMSIEWKDREKAAHWANAMIADLNLELRKRAVSEAERSIEFLNAELVRVKEAEARAAVYGLLERQIQKIMLANVREDYAFRILDQAIAPEADDFFKPNRPLLAALGLVAGIVLAAFLSLFLAFRERLD